MQLQSCFDPDQSGALHCSTFVCVYTALKPRNRAQISSGIFARMQRGPMLCSKTLLSSRKARTTPHHIFISILGISILSTSSFSLAE
ncbi:hypothetical protein L1887_46834 [Cichorium endivia]|nr:hypothetical protein L1887_46834 [Cichorium endivia]